MENFTPSLTFEVDRMTKKQLQEIYNELLLFLKKEKVFENVDQLIIDNDVQSATSRKMLKENYYSLLDLYKRLKSFAASVKDTESFCYTTWQRLLEENIRLKESEIECWAEDVECCTFTHENIQIQNQVQQFVSKLKSDGVQNLRELEQTKQQCHDLTNEVHQLRSSNENAQREREVQGFLTKISGNVLENIRVMETNTMAAKISQLKVELEISKKELEDLTEQAKHELENTKKELDASTEEAKQLRTANKKLESKQDVTHIINGVLDSVAEKQRQKEEQKMNDKIEQLESELKNIKKELDASTEEAKQLRKANNKLESKQIANHIINGVLDSVAEKQRQKEEQKMNDKIEQLQSELEYTKQDLMGKNNQLKREIEELKAQLPPPKKTWSIDDDESGGGVLAFMCRVH